MNRYISLLLLLISVSNAHTQNNCDIKILVTAPEGYSSRLQNSLIEQGFCTVAIPTIETKVQDNSEDIEQFINRIASYDYVAFSSRKAIDAFSDGLKKYSEIRKQLANVQFCAIGKDCDYMTEKLGLNPAFLPDEPSPLGIAKRLEKIKETAGKKIAVLVPKVEVIREPNIVPDFINKLNEIGMNVERVDAYVTKPTNKDDLKKIVSLISSNQVKCIAFTSSAEIEVLLHSLTDRAVLNNVTIACFGPYTAAYAKNKGLNVSVVAEDFSSFNGFASAIKAFYTNQH